MPKGKKYLPHDSLSIEPWDDPGLQQKLVRSEELPHVFPVSKQVAFNTFDFESNSSFSVQCVKNVLSKTNFRLFRFVEETRRALNKLVGTTRPVVKRVQSRINQGNCSRQVDSPAVPDLVISETLRKGAENINQAISDLPSDVECMRELLKQKYDPDESYAKVAASKHEPIIADLLAERADTSDESSVDMIARLPVSEAERYNNEERLVVREGKSKVEAAALRERFGRLNGTMSEYIKYLNREDVRTLWTLLYPEDVCGVAGISSVWKSNGLQLRKLLMCCETNYWWVDPKALPEIGMGG